MTIGLDTIYPLLVQNVSLVNGWQGTGFRLAYPESPSSFERLLAAFEYDGAESPMRTGRQAGAAIPAIAPSASSSALRRLSADKVASRLRPSTRENVGRPGLNLLRRRTVFGLPKTDAARLRGRPVRLSCGGRIIGSGPQPERLLSRNMIMRDLSHTRRRVSKISQLVMEGRFIRYYKAELVCSIAARCSCGIWKP